VRGHDGVHWDRRKPLLLGLSLELEEGGHGGAKEVALGHDPDHTFPGDDRQVPDAPEPHDPVGEIQRVRGLERDDFGPHEIAYVHAFLQSKFHAAIGTPGAGARMSRRPVPTVRLGDLLATERGLAADEVGARRQRFGANDIVEVLARPWWDLLRDTARDPMLWFLVGTAALYALVGDRIEAGTVLAALLPLLAMDGFLHRRTRASTEGLTSRLAARATVLRDGTATVVPATDVVAGDLALVVAGEAFPADGLIVGGSELQADESALTGEAYPVRKHPLSAPLREGSEPAVDAGHWGFAGTRLLAGNARVRIVFTGGETLYGEIVRSATRGAGGRTPLQAAIGSLVSVLVVAAVAMCLILAFVRLHQGHGWVDALVSAVTLAVAALPEEFPVVLAVFLGVGVYRLARRQALVRRAVSVENIGRTSCICTDKTGTITEGRLRLTHVVPAAGVERSRVLELAAIASRPDAGDPLDAAIASEAGVAPPRVAVFPFTEARKRETAIVREGDGGPVCATKGAVEVVLAMSAEAPSEQAAWSARATALADEGHKVIACAWRPIDEAGWAGGEPDRGFRLAGLLAFEDPVRDGVAEAIAACKGAGIRAIMVTGDHPATARAVAREIGLGGEVPAVVEGDEIETLGPGRLARIDVVARAVPAQKLALVRALKAAGEIVAVTGDGVNDVPALQAADVGIAMGERGTRSAREIASIVLLDDNFRTIVGAIAEGRQLFRNLKLSFQYLLMIHIPLVVTAALVPLAGYPLLYLPAHIVWLELVIHPTAMLVFQDLPPGGRLAPVRRGVPARFFSRREWTVIGAVGTLATLLVMGGYVRSLGEMGNVPHARGMALSVLTFTSAALTAALSGLRTVVSRLVAGGTVALSVALVQVPALAALLHLQPLHADDWAAAVGASIAAAVLLVLGGAAARTGGVDRVMG
jgi:P-type Ca2+ transporter type 2C